MSWEVQKYAVKLELLQPMLGTVPLSESVWDNYMAGKMTKQAKKDGISEEEIKARIAEDIGALPEDNELVKGLTGFLRDEQGIYIKDHMLKGFFKFAAQSMKQYGALKQLQDKVRRYLFVRPNKIYLGKADEKLDIVERPLRAQTAQGERTAIARSESIPAGRIIDVEITILQDVLPEKLVRALLDYGQYCGLGQFRTGSYGSFTVNQCEAL